MLDWIGDAGGVTERSVCSSLRSPAASRPNSGQLSADPLLLRYQSPSERISSSPRCHLPGARGMLA